MNNISVLFIGKTNKLLTVKKEGRKGERMNGWKELRKGGKKKGFVFFHKGLPWSFFFFFFCTTNQHNGCVIISINQLPWDRSQGRGKKYPFTLLALVNEMQ